MEKNTANINALLNQISSAVTLAKSSGVAIDTSFSGDCLICLSQSEGINSTIELTSSNAISKMNTLLQSIYSITPASNAMQEVSNG